MSASDLSSDFLDFLRRIFPEGYEAVLARRESREAIGKRLAAVSYRVEALPSQFGEIDEIKGIFREVLTIVAMIALEVAERP